MKLPAHFFFVIFFIYTLAFIHEAGHYFASLFVGGHPHMTFDMFFLPRSVLSTLNDADPLYKLKVIFVTLTGDIMGIIPPIFVYRYTKDNVIQFLCIWFIIYSVLVGNTGDYQIIAKLW